MNRGFELAGVPLAITSGLQVYGGFFVLVIIGFLRRLMDCRRSAATRTQEAVVA